MNPLALAVEVVGIVVPIVTAVLVDGIRTRTKVALIEQAQKYQAEDIAENTRRQARHERDPVHARMRPPR